MLIGRLPLRCMALGLVDDAKMRRDSAGIAAPAGTPTSRRPPHDRAGGPRQQPLRQLTTLAALAEHISASSVLDGATCVAFRTFRYVV